MPLTSAILLKRLEPAVRPVASSRTSPKGEFAGMLEMVATGTPWGRCPVRLNGVSELTESQQTRLAAAADLALSEGFSRVVVAVDGRHFITDVTSANDRQIHEEIKPTSLMQLTEVQAVIHAADPEAKDAVAVLRPPHSGPPIASQRSIQSNSPSSATRA